MVKLSEANLSDGGELSGASGCFGGGFSGSSNRRAVISNNYEKIRRQRCRTASTVLCHQLVCRPNVIVISIVSVGRMKCLTESQLAPLLPSSRTFVALFVSREIDDFNDECYIFLPRWTAAVTAHVLGRRQTRGSF